MNQSHDNTCQLYVRTNTVKYHILPINKTYGHVQSRMNVVVGRISSPSRNTAFIQISEFELTIFINTLALQNWTQRNNLWHVLWLWISVFCSVFFMFIFVWPAILLIYMQVNGNIFRSLRRCLHETCLPIPLSICITIIYNSKVLNFQNHNSKNETVPGMSKKICITYGLITSLRELIFMSLASPSLFLAMLMITELSYIRL